HVRPSIVGSVTHRVWAVWPIPGNPRRQNLTGDACTDRTVDLRSQLATIDRVVERPANPDVVERRDPCVHEGAVGDGYHERVHRAGVPRLQLGGLRAEVEGRPQRRVEVAVLDGGELVADRDAQCDHDLVGQ